jgi:putative SOS response-associated peptidase YedK
MCGRFAITTASDAMARLFAATPANDLPSVPNYNVCPTNSVHVVTAVEGRRLTAMRWGFIPHWYTSPVDGPLLINARAESIAKKLAFAAACRDRRCLIPADGFYEWTKDAGGNRLPWYITRTDGAPIAFAGVWQDWGRGEDRVANQAMSQIHHRVPVMIDPDNWPLWLGEAGHGAATLMQAPPEGALRFWRVDPTVNSNRAAGPELIEPIEK